MPALRREDDPRGAHDAFADPVVGRHAPLTKATATPHHRRDPADGEGPFERDDTPPSTLDLDTTAPRLTAKTLATCARHHRTTL